ncbi:MAG: YihY/virulence factor BrkB family protein [Solirubrobacterales bacterium]
MEDREVADMTEEQAEKAEVREQVEPRRADYEPEGTDERTGAWPTLKKTALEFNEDHMTDWAAALTYYGLLSLFPALIAIVSIVGLFADPESATESLTDIVTQIGPDTAADTFAGPIDSITSNRSAAGVLFVVGLAAALWSASGYVGAFSRAANVIWETPEGRPFLKLRPLQLGVTLLLVVLFALVAVSLVMTGPIVQAVGDSIGIGDTALTIWDIAKWPVLLAIAIFMVGVLYYSAPNVKLPGFRWLTPGSVVAVGGWVVASAGFAFYVANFGSYDKTYGSLGAIVTLLIWVWISNLALLFGMELNAERERNRELEAGVPRAHKEIQLEPRAEPGNKRTT